MAEVTSSRRILFLFVGAILASFVIICFLNWEARRRYDLSQDESITIIKKQEEIQNNSSTTIITVIRTKFSHLLSHIKSKIKEKLLIMLQDDEPVHGPSKNESHLARRKRSINHDHADGPHHVDEEKLQRHLLHHGLNNNMIKHLRGKVHKLHTESPLVKEILRQFGHHVKCHHHGHHHRKQNQTKNHHHSHYNKVNVSVQVQSPPSLKRNYHIIPQAASEDVVHDNRKKGYDVCGSTGDVILIIISTTLINWTLLVIALVVRAIFLQRELLCSDPEEDSIPIATCEDQYKRLHEDEHDSIIIKPSSQKI